MSDNIFDQDPTDAAPSEALTHTTPMLPMMPRAAGSNEFDMLLQLSAGRTRDNNDLLKRAIRVGERMGERALYSFPAGGGRIEGPTIHLAEELAGEWGSLMWGVRQDGRDGREVHFIAFVVDAIRGTICTRPATYTLSPPPSKFANKADQAARWDAMQEQAATSKAVRTAILHSLPQWYIDAAVDASRAVTRRDVLKGKSLADAIADALAAFKTQHIDQEDLEGHLRADLATWTVSDVVALRNLYGKLQRGELNPLAVFGERSEPAPAPSASGRSALGITQQEDPAPIVAEPEPEKVPVQQAAPEPEAAQAPPPEEKRKGWGVKPQPQAKSPPPTNDEIPEW